MATVYKLTTEDDTSTRGEMTWGVAATNAVDPETSTDEPLCTSSWIHVYKSAPLVHFLNPAHLNLDTYHVWQATGTIVKSKQQVIHGCRELTTNSELVLSFPTIEQRRNFAVLCALEINGEPLFLEWQTAWAADTLEPNQTANFINTLYADMVAAVRNSAELSQRAAAAAMIAARYIDDAGAINDAMLADRAARRALAAIAGGTSFDSMMTAVAEANRRSLAAAEAAIAAAVGADAVYPALVDAKRLAMEASSGITPALPRVVALFAARATLTADESTVAALAAKCAVMVGDYGDSVEGGITIDFVAIAEAALA
jgi:hypothetical protein